MAKKFSELQCGSKIRFGSYSVEGEVAHQIKWIKVNSDDTTILTEHIEDFRAFDAKERNNEDEYRRRYGNNRYSVSNIDQFLNSSNDKWYNASHKFDEPPTRSKVTDHTEYADHPGFLCCFKEWELDTIIDTEITTALAICDGNDKYETVVRKVFLPSLTNIFGQTVREVDEGSYWDYFRNGGDRVARSTSYAIDETMCESKPRSCNDPWYYLLRSPYAGGSCSVRYVDRGGDWGYCNAYYGILGVRPALRLNPDILVSDEPDEEGYYEIIQSESELDDISDDELFDLLMK